MQDVLPYIRGSVVAAPDSPPAHRIGSKNHRFSEAKPGPTTSWESLMTDRPARGPAPVSPAGGGLPTPGDLAAVGSYLAAAQTDSTRRAYARDVAAWRTWCTGRGLTALPADPLAVAAWLAHLADAA